MNFLETKRSHLEAVLLGTESANRDLALPFLPSAHRDDMKP
jgi:hypothetical protein